MTKEEQKWIDDSRRPGSCPFDFKVFAINEEVEIHCYPGRMIKALLFWESAQFRI